MKKLQPQSLCRTGLFLLLGGLRRGANQTTGLLKWWEGRVSEQVDRCTLQQGALKERLYQLSHRLDGVMDAVESRIDPRRME